MRLRVVTAAEEQAWNERALAQPVGTPDVAVFAYREPAVVLGVSQLRTYGAVDERAGLPVISRRTGGGAVWVGPGVLGVSVVLPPDHPLAGRGPVGAFEWFGRAHAAALDGLGIACEVVEPQAARARNQEPDPVGWACFGSLGAWEVVLADRRKVVGLAQRRSRHGVLLVGGVLVEDPDWKVLCAALGAPADAEGALLGRTSSCCAALGRPVGIERVAEAVSERLFEALATAP